MTTEPAMSYSKRKGVLSDGRGGARGSKEEQRNWWGGKRDTDGGREDMSDGVKGHWAANEEGQRDRSHGGGGG